MRVGFLGWVVVFFLSSDFTVFTKVFYLFSLQAGFSILRDDSLSLIELSFTFIMFSYWVAQTLFWTSFSSSMIFFSLSLSSRCRLLFIATIFSWTFCRSRYLASFSLSFSSQNLSWIDSDSNSASLSVKSSTKRCFIQSNSSFFCRTYFICQFSFTSSSWPRSRSLIRLVSDLIRSCSSDSPLAVVFSTFWWLMRISNYSLPRLDDFSSSATSIFWTACCWKSLISSISIVSRFFCPTALGGRWKLSSENSSKSTS